jgi:hypothetical protein
MAGGINDSSLTRVRPVFSALAQLAAPSWLLRLVRLGSRASRLDLPEATAPLVSPPAFEHPCLPPEELLRWMITNASRLDWSKLEVYGSKLAPSTIEKRRALRNSDLIVMQEALAMLQTRGRRHGSGQWHVLEGVTKVDCALFGEDVTIFVEGKRTEPHLTKHVSWLRGRDQVLRNLDCLRVDPRRATRWFVLLVVDDNTTAEADARQLDLGGERVRTALPHLPADDVNQLWSHYAGYTTWPAIHHEFHGTSWSS